MRDETKLASDLQKVFDAHAALARNDLDANAENLLNALAKRFDTEPPDAPPAPPRGLPPRPPGGKPTPMSGDDQKPRVDFLHTAFLWLAGALIVAIGTVIGITVSLGNATNARLDKASETVSTLNREIGETSTKVDEANTRLTRIEEKLDRAIERLPR